MTPEFPPNNPRAELEARLTAFILGELPAHEAAALRQTIDDDAELAALYDRLNAAHKLVREAVASPAEPAKESAAPLRLSEARRQKLLAQFKTVAPKEFAPAKRPDRKVWHLALEIAAVLAIIGLLASLGIPNFVGTRMTSQRNSVINNLRQIDGAKQQWALETHAPPDAEPKASDIQPYLGRGKNGSFPQPIAGEKYEIGKLSESPTADFGPKTTLGKRGKHVAMDADGIFTTNPTGPAPARAYAATPAPAGTPPTLGARSGNYSYAYTTTPAPGAVAEEDQAHDLERFYAQRTLQSDGNSAHAISPPPRPAKTTIVLPPVENSGNGDVSLTWKTQDGSTPPPVALGNVPVVEGRPSTGGTGGATGTTLSGYHDTSANWNFGDGSGRTAQLASSASSSQENSKVDGYNYNSVQVKTAPPAQPSQFASDDLNAGGTAVASGQPPGGIDPATGLPLPPPARPTRGDGIRFVTSATNSYVAGNATLSFDSQPYATSGNEVTVSGGATGGSSIPHISATENLGVSGANSYAGNTRYRDLQDRKEQASHSDWSNKANAQSGDPEWIGFLEHPEQRNSASNFFQSRGAFVAIPQDSLDHDSIYRNQGVTASTPPVSTSASVRGYYDDAYNTDGVSAANGSPKKADADAVLQGLAQLGKTPVVIPAKPNAEFRFYLDENGNGSFDTNGIVTAKSADFAQPNYTVANGTSEVLTVPKITRENGGTANAEAIQSINEALKENPPQVNVRAKFADVTQQDNRALGFNWKTDKSNLGPNVVASGGTQPSFHGVQNGVNSPIVRQQQGVDNADGFNANPVAMNPDGAFPGQRAPVAAGIAAASTLQSEAAGRKGKLESPRAGGASGGSSMRQDPSLMADDGQNFTYTVVDGKLVPTPAPNNDFHFGTVPYVTGTYFGGINGQAASQYAYVPADKVPRPEVATESGQVSKAESPRAAESRQYFSGIGAINNGVVANPIPFTDTTPRDAVADAGAIADADKLTTQVVPVRSLNRVTAGNSAPALNSEPAAQQPSDASSNVETVNVVGYVNVKVTNGFNLVANQFDVDADGKPASVSSPAYVSTNGTLPAGANPGQRTSGFADRLKSLGLKSAGIGSSGQAASISTTFDDSVQPPVLAALPKTPTDKVPRLGDLPLLGMLGRPDGNTNTTAEPILHAGETDYPDMSVNELLDVYGKLTGRNIVAAPNLPQTRINLATTSDLTESQAKQAIESVLAMNGVSVVNVGSNAVKAVPVAMVGTLGSSFSTNATSLGNVTVSVDPETKRVFRITDAATPPITNGRKMNLAYADLQSTQPGSSLAQANVLHQNSLKIDAETQYVKQEELLAKLKKEREELAQNQSKIPINYAKASDISEALRKQGADKEKELDQLVATREATAKKAAEYAKTATTPLVEIIEEADGKRERSLGGINGWAPPANIARINIDRDLADPGAVTGKPDSGVYDPYFVQTEFEVIQSEKVLDKVIERLKLNEVWAQKGGGRPLKTSETRQLLKRRLHVSSEGIASQVDIKVDSDDPKEAAKIANTIAEVYRDHRKDQQAGVTFYKGQLAEEDEKIAQVKAELAQLASKPVGQQADAPPPKPAAPPPIPQPEVSAAENPFSTFSLNISDVSLKLAAASLEKGQMPDASTIRSEEFINAFDYRDPEPAPGAPLGFAWERAQYPFAHNRDLLRFAVKTAATGRDPGRPLNIVLLLDKSGSMERADRVRIVHEALRVLATQLQPQDKISVVTFARVARLWVDGLSGSQAAEVADGLDQLTPEGGTNLEEAMRLAYETARRHYLANGINRVVLLTDGAANLGNVDPDALKVKAEEHRKEGIALDCFGVGWEGYNDDLLEVLSRNGGGRYGFINTPEEAATDFAGQLAGALNVAAYDVKVQVEFNPKRVTNWRQIGYAKHQLTKEQFRDNTVKAAQIAAAESGNGLYAIEVNPNGEGPIATVRVRYRVPGTEDYPEHEYQVPYTGGALPLEQSSPAMRLMGSASAFSEWLVSSPFAGEVTTDKLLGLMSGVPETYGADQRPKKLEWMIRQAKSLEGK